MRHIIEKFDRNISPQKYIENMEVKIYKFNSMELTDVINLSSKSVTQGSLFNRV